MTGMITPPPLNLSRYWKPMQSVRDRDRSPPPLGMWMTSHGQCPRGVLVNVQEWGWFSIFRRADDVTRTMSKGGCLWMSSPPPPPFRKSCIRAWIGTPPPPKKKALPYFAHCLYGAHFSATLANFLFPAIGFILQSSVPSTEEKCNPRREIWYEVCTFRPQYVM